MPLSTNVGKADLALTSSTTGLPLVSTGPITIPMFDPNLVWDHTDSTFQPVGFKEPTGSLAGPATHFGRNDSGDYQQLGSLDTANTGINPLNNPDMIHNKVGRGTLQMVDFRDKNGGWRVTPRRFYVGPFDYGLGIYSLDPGPGDVLEIAPGDGGVGLRCNVPGTNRHIFEVRRPSDDNGVVMAWTTASADTLNAGDSANGLPWSGMYGDAGYIFARKPGANGLVFHNFDGTGGRIGQDGLISFGMRMLRANRMVQPLPAGTPVAAIASDVRFGSGATEFDSTIGLGFYNPEFNSENTPWRIRRRGSDGAFSIGNYLSGTESVAGSLYCSTSGGWSIGVAPTAQKLTVNGTTWVGTGAGTAGRGLVIDGGAGFATAGITSSGSGGNRFGLYLSGFGSDWLDIGRNSSNSLVRVYGDNSVLLSAAQLATNATAGFTYLPSCAGTPTGAPNTYSGMSGVPMVVDTTGSKLWFRIGGVWKSTTLA